jgi:TatD DNase family protein
MELIDTHAHLNLPDFQSDLDAVIERARVAGVKFIINVGIDIPSSQKAIALAVQYKSLFAVVGIHPHDAQKVSESDWITLEKLLQEPKVVALGEIGLDYYKNYSPHDIQEEIFRKQLALAQKHDKPLIIHCREAHKDCLDILNEVKWSGMRGVAHCFSGDLAIARQYIDLGFLLAFGGPVTYPNAVKLREVIQQIDIKYLMLETDCPYLTPQSKRGQRNEPAYLTYCAEQWAKIYRLPVEEIGRVTTQNAQRLFRLV